MFANGILKIRPRLCFQREWLQRDVDRERRLRLDTEARLKGSSSEADKCRVKLANLQKDFTK